MSENLRQVKEILTCFFIYNGQVYVTFFVEKILKNNDYNIFHSLYIRFPEKEDGIRQRHVVIKNTRKTCRIYIRRVSKIKILWSFTIL